MRKAYFHIGFGKTGSSSLQSYLSFNPELRPPETKEKLIYCCFLKDGRVLFGDELRQRAQQSPFNYCASVAAVAKMGGMDYLKAEVDRIYEAGYIPIFSQEDWGRRTGEFRESNFFNKLNIHADVIVYIRPQVDWFNSAWWQWFAWEKSFNRPQDVIDAWGYNIMLWASHISRWDSLDGVKKVTVRLQPADIIEDFLSLFKISPEPGISQKFRVNASLPPMLIKLLLKYPYIRRTQSAYVDILLSRFLKFEGKSPWIIGPELSQQIIAATRIDSEKLLWMLDEASRKTMKNDPRWWDADHYKSRYVFNEKDLVLSKSELFSIIAQTIPALINLCKCAK